MFLYAFVLGRVYTLSLAELLAVLDNMGITYRVAACSPEVVVLETEKQLDASKLQARIGGVIKIIRLFDTFQKKGKEYPSQTLANYFTFKRIKDYFTDYSGKRQFGVSIYVLDPTLRFREESQRIAFYIKKILQEQSQSVRAVIPQFPSQSLSSVLVNENQLLTKGAEIVVICGNQKVFVGKTLTVQNYDDYGRRDYQRPARDEHAGMIPPKVAQSMLNLAGNLKPMDYILDPFCGSGTILQEAILMGLRAVGSDLDQTAIENSEKNLEWFRNRYHVAPNRYKLMRSHAAEISMQLQGSSLNISAVVTEGTLGPIYGKLPKKTQMVTNFKNLTKLYEQVFKELNKSLPDGARVVMCLPAYKVSQSDYEFMPTLDFATENGYTVSDPIPEALRTKYKFLRVTGRKSIVYDRKDQVVAREIVIFYKGSPEFNTGIEQESSSETVVDGSDMPETESDKESTNIQ
jgi:tRNA G10  N-methylase Trm11